MNGGKRAGAGRPCLHKWYSMDVGDKFVINYHPHALMGRYNKKLAPKRFKARPIYVMKFNSLYKSHYEIERIL